jgi:hypothetical protein
MSTVGHPGKVKGTTPIQMSYTLGPSIDSEDDRVVFLSNIYTSHNLKKKRQSGVQN